MIVVKLRNDTQNVQKYVLKEMFVANSTQRAGVRWEMLAALRGILAAKGVETIILFTSRAIYPYDFYLGNGFTVLENMRMLKG